MAKDDETTTETSTVDESANQEVVTTNDPNNLVDEPANDHVLGEGDDVNYDPYEAGRADALKNAANEDQNA